MSQEKRPGVDDGGAVGGVGRNLPAMGGHSRKALLPVALGGLGLSPCGPQGSCPRFLNRHVTCSSLTWGSLGGGWSPLPLFSAARQLL